MQTFPLPLCQGIRGFSVTKQKALAKASVFALMKRSAASLSEEEARKIFFSASPRVARSFLTPARASGRI